jgi:tol-pal system protein YbgF
MEGLLEGDFYFKRGQAAPETANPVRDERGLKPIQAGRIPAAPASDPAETAYWLEVQKSEDADYYAAYLANYPNGLHIADANEYIERDKQVKAAREKLKEDQDWQKAQSGESHASYEAYLKVYPSGRYAKLVEHKLKNLGGAARDCPDCPERGRVAEERAYEVAHNLIKGGNYKEAVGAFQSFLDQYPSSSMAANALYWMGFSHAVGLSDPKSASESYQRLLKEFPNSPKAPDALLSLARAQVKLDDSEAARTSLNLLLNKHPQSKAAEYGKKLLATLK